MEALRNGSFDRAKRVTDSRHASGSEARAQSVSFPIAPVPEKCPAAFLAPFLEAEFDVDFAFEIAFIPGNVQAEKVARSTDLGGSGRVADLPGGAAVWRRLHRIRVAAQSAHSPGDL